MQPLPFISSDLFVSVPAASMLSAKTGSEGDFASALATAANGQQGNGAQTAARGAGKDSSLPGQQPARLDSSETPGEFADPQELDTSMNGAAGAANLVMLFPQWNASGTGLAISATITGELPEQSAVSQMLSAIALTGTTAATGELQAGASTQGNAQKGNAQTAVSGTAVAEVVDSQAQGRAFLLKGMDVEQMAAEPAQKTLQTMATPVQQTQAATPQTVLAATMTGNAAEATTPVEAITFQPETTAAGKTTNDITVLTAGSAEETKHTATQQGARVFVQDEPAQVVVTSQAATDEQAPQAAATGSGAASGSETAGIRQEINGNYIRSNLPNSVADTAQDDDASKQKDQAGDKGQNSGASANTTGQSLGEQMQAQRAQATAAQDGQPLIFAHQLDSSQSTATGSTAQASTDPSMIRLPSGTMVPEGTAMDQMIAHFAMSRRLETSTVNLRLHPQELGELRMEIKVEQDNIKAHIIAQTPHAQEMIDRHLPRLREALEQQGLHLAQVEVTLAANDRTDSQAFQDNLRQNLMNRTLKNKSTQPVFPLGAGEETEEVVQTPIALSVMA